MSENNDVSPYVNGQELQLTIRREAADSHNNSPKRCFEDQQITNFAAQNKLITSLDRQIDLRKDKVPMNGDSISQFHYETFVPREGPIQSSSGFKTNQSSSESYDLLNYAKVLFATERINLPRDKVVDAQSNQSSPSHGFKQEISPLTQITAFIAGPAGAPTRPSLRPGTISPSKIKNVYMKQPPAFDPNIDYYKEFWRMYLQNENLVSDIDQTASSNYRMTRKIFNIKDFYENTLVPQIFTQPHKFLHRLRQ
jgi:hypothetical protein